MQVDQVRFPVLAGFNQIPGFSMFSVIDRVNSVFVLLKSSSSVSGKAESETVCVSVNQDWLLQKDDTLHVILACSPVFAFTHTPFVFIRFLFQLYFHAMLFYSLHVIFTVMFNYVILIIVC